MSNPEKLIDVLTVIAIMLILIICGLCLFYVWLKHRNAQKREQKIDEAQENNQSGKNTSYSTKSIFKFMEFEKIEDNMIIQKNGKYLMVIECQGVNYDLMSEMERLAVEQGFIQFLNSLNTEIQIHVQTRTVNLEESIYSYKGRFKEIEEKYRELENKYKIMKKSEDYSEQQIREAYMEMVKQRNKYEYTQDIIKDAEKNSLNRTVLHKKYYIIIPHYEDEIITQNASQEEIRNMIFSELYTKARSIIRTLSKCQVNAKILDSEGLIDLLYVAYNRDESDILGARRALQAGFHELYTTAPDVFERKLKLLDKEIEEEGIRLAGEAITEARSDKEMLLRIRERNRQNLIFDFANNLISESERIVGEDVAADAKAKIKSKKKETQKGGTKDGKETKSTGRRKSDGQ